jgi:hypothetical protein
VNTKATWGILFVCVAPFGCGAARMADASKQVESIVIAKIPAGASDVSVCFDPPRAAWIEGERGAQSVVYGNRRYETGANVDWIHIDEGRDRVVFKSYKWDEPRLVAGDLVFGPLYKIDWVILKPSGRIALATREGEEGWELSGAPELGKLDLIGNLRARGERWAVVARQGGRQFLIDTGKVHERYEPWRRFEVGGVEAGEVRIVRVGIK